MGWTGQGLVHFAPQGKLSIGRQPAKNIIFETRKNSLIITYRFLRQNIALAHMIQRCSRHPSNIQNQYSLQFRCHPLKPLFERHQLDDSHTLGEMVEVGMDLNMEFRMGFHQLGSKNLKNYHIGPI